MLWKRKLGIILIFHDRIELRVEGFSVPSIFPFPTPVVHNLELIDQIGFEKAFKLFLEREKILQSSIALVLDDSFIFWKKLTPDVADSDFFGRIPLPLDQQTHKQVQIGSDTILAAHNNAIVESIQRILHEKNNVVIAILPFFAFPAFEDKQMDVMNVDMSTARKLHQYNSEILKFKRRVPFFNIFITIAIVVTTITGGVLFSSYNQRKKSIQPVYKKTHIPPTQAPTIHFLNPKDIRIDIQNGSGRFGEAGRLKARLENEKYTILSIGNSEVDIQKTRIVPKMNVPNDFISSLSALLEKQYTLDASPPAQLEATWSADIIIIIGTDFAQ